jgi:hypothetical protein
MAFRGNGVGFRQVWMQGSHAGSISSQHSLRDGRSTWMPATYDPSAHAAVTRAAHAADWLRAHGGLGQDRQDRISVPETLDYWDEIRTSTLARAAMPGVRWSLEVVAVSIFDASHLSRRSTRPILGLRRTPGRLALFLFRLQLPLYRRGWGWLLGHTFLLLDHAGRKTGQRHSKAAMVLRYGPREYVTSQRAHRLLNLWQPQSLGNRDHGLTGR